MFESAGFKQISLRSSSKNKFNHAMISFVFGGVCECKVFVGCLEAKKMGVLIAGLILLGLGLLYVIKPKTGHYILYRSKIEPTKFGLICVRIVGVCITIIGLAFVTLTTIVVF